MASSENEFDKMTIAELEYYRSVAKAQLPTAFARALSSPHPEPEAAFRRLRERETLLSKALRKALKAQAEQDSAEE